MKDFMDRYGKRKVNQFTTQHLLKWIKGESLWANIHNPCWERIKQVGEKKKG